MPQRVNPIILLGLVITIILSFGIFATAKSGGGTASDAVATGEAQIGKPWVMSTDGPDTFSCAGLMRYILRTIGVDANAPWTPEAYLGAYPAADLSNLQPGDIVIYPNWATMYVGNGMLLNSNEMLGYVTHTSMSDAGTPVGAVRPPYGGSQPLSDPAPADTAAGDPVVGDPLLAGGSAGTDPLTQYATDPVLGAVDPAVDPVLGNPLANDATQYLTDPVPATGDPVTTDPVPTDPAPADPVPADPVPAANEVTQPVPTDPAPADPVPAGPVPAAPAQV